MKTFFVSQKDLRRFLNDVARYYVLYVIKEAFDQLSYHLYDEQDATPVIVDRIRAREPLKAIFFRSHEKVATFPHPEQINRTKKPFAALGAKSCDVAALKSLDLIFNDEPFKDSFYAENRENNLIISADCSYFGQSCFCLLLDIYPYTTEGFDLNLSAIRDGFLLDIGTKKGENIVSQKRYLKQPTENQLTERKRNRQKLVESFKQAASSKFSLAGKFYTFVKNNYDSVVWKDFVKSCVECGGCNLVCPTCHCFLLYDKKGHENYERFKLWDACQYAGFARVAGGANPRKKLYERLRNRYVHKFVHFKENYDIFACTGCGRCADICMGKIDMREVISALNK